MVPLDADSAASEHYDFLNLTATSRTAALQAQFEAVEQLLKEDLRAEEFSDFGLPTQDCI